MCVFLKHTEEYFFLGGQDIFTVGTFYVLYCHNEMTLQLNEIKQQLHSGVASVMNLLCPAQPVGRAQFDSLFLLEKCVELN